MLDTNIFKWTTLVNSIIYFILYLYIYHFYRKDMEDVEMYYQKDFTTRRIFREGGNPGGTSGQVDGLKQFEEKNNIDIDIDDEFDNDASFVKMSVILKIILFIFSCVVAFMNKMKKNTSLICMIIIHTLYLLHSLLLVGNVYTNRLFIIPFFFSDIQKNHM